VGNDEAKRLRGECSVMMIRARLQGLDEDRDGAVAHLDQRL
jgi:hypothetical protein